MAITTYLELQAAAKSFLHRVNLLGAVSEDMVPDLIQLGEKRIFREVRHRTMESALSSVIAGGVIPVPSDYVALRHVYVDGDPVTPLQRRTIEYVYTKYPKRASDGKPAVIAREVANFIFGPFPDSTYTIKGTYYKRLTSITSSVNALFTESSDLYLFATLSEARAFIEEGNDIIELWDVKYRNIAGLMSSEENEDDFSGSAPTMKSDITYRDELYCY